MWKKILVTQALYYGKKEILSCYLNRLIVCQLM